MASWLSGPATVRSAIGIAVQLDVDWPNYVSGAVLYQWKLLQCNLIAIKGVFCSLEVIFLLSQLVVECFLNSRKNMYACDCTVVYSVGAAHTAFRQQTSSGRKIIFRNRSCQLRPKSHLHSVFFAKWSQGLLGELCNSRSHFLQLSWSVQHHVSAHFPPSRSSERSL